jgi:N-acetylmuramoyl-L-alanine amidase
LAGPAHADADADRFDTIVIDAGHGGDDHGARGSGGLIEKDLVLDIGLRVAKELRAAGLEVVLTRTGDRFVGLDERTSVANDARADLFVSIHANGSRARQARGIETFFAALEASDESAAELARAENEAFGPKGTLPMPSDDPLFAVLGDMIATEHLKDSQEFARLAQHALVDERHRSRGVKQAPFVVLMGVQMPAALVEIGFITNARDERELGSTQQRERIAVGLAGAIREFGRRFDARRGDQSAAAGSGREAGGKF